MLKPWTQRKEKHTFADIFFEMKKYSLIVAGLLALSSHGYAQKSKKDTKVESKQIMLNTPKDSLSYSLGLNIAKNLKSQGFTDLNLELLAKAFADFYGNQPTLIDVNKTDGIINEYFSSMKKKQSDENLKKGQDFLAENKKKPGIKVTASGLQYEVIKEGDGPKPAATDKVKTHYHGMLIDGTVFDSSVQRGEPATFPLNAVIKGWTEALQLMNVGSKWRLFLPSDLAYGERGAGANIGPNSALIFEVELLSIEK